MNGQPDTEFDMNNVNLPKWPQLVVVGEPVTVEQAAEIIIRTDGLYFSTNDKLWHKQLCEAAGLKTPKDDSFGYISWEDRQPLFDSVNSLHLSYLNTSQIASCYMLGPHGWIDWNGNVGCYDFNIGKWPACEDVFNDWKVIAEAFPFLELKSQLSSKESCEEGGIPLIEFHVSKGSVTCYEPTQTLVSKHSGVAYASNQSLINRFSSWSAERGCTIEQFKTALKFCQEKKLAGG